MTPRTDWEGVRLHVVTGKGGTGKTTVAAALALALAAGGKRVLLCEAEGRQGIARLFDVPPLPYEERPVAVAPDGGDVLALAIDAEAALLEYLDMYYKLGRAGRALDRFGVIDFATTIAPGLQDVLLTGKVYEAARRRDRQAPPGQRPFVYDAVVLDAPPTGRITRFLNVNKEVAGLAKVGPVRNQAESIMKLLHSARTAVHLVTILEDMPVQETIDGIAALGEASLPVGAVVVNMAGRSPLEPGDLELAAARGIAREDVARGLKAAGLEPADEVVDGLVEQAHDHAERITLEEEYRTRIESLGRPCYELEELVEGVDLGGLYELAEELREQGMA